MLHPFCFLFVFFYYLCKRKETITPSIPITTNIYPKSYGQDYDFAVCFGVDSHIGCHPVCVVLF